VPDARRAVPALPAGFWRGVPEAHLHDSRPGHRDGLPYHAIDRRPGPIDIPEWLMLRRALRNGFDPAGHRYVQNAHKNRRHMALEIVVCICPYRFYISLSILERAESQHGLD